MLLNELTIKNIGEKKLEALMKHPRFMAWFRNSKVIDNGLPDIVYHYTSNNDFKLFQPFSHFGTNKAANVIHNNKIDTFGYEYTYKGRTVPVILSIQNPLEVIDFGNHDYSEYLYELIEMDIFTKNDLMPLFNTVQSKITRYEYYKKCFLDLQQKLLKKGYDGFKYKNTEEDKGSISWIILKPSQALPAFKLFSLVKDIK